MEGPLEGFTPNSCASAFAFLMPPLPPRIRRVELSVGWGTLFKLGLFAALVYVVLKLIPLCAMLLLALLIAITIWPVADWIMRRGGPKWIAVTACALLLFGSLALFLFVVSPIATSQVSAFIKTLPTMKDHILQRLPETGSTRDIAEGLMQTPAFVNSDALLKQFVSWAVLALTRMLEVGVVLIIAVYLIADGKRVYEWLIAFLPERQRQRVATAAPEIFTVVFSYMGGQLITSLLCAGFVWGMLTLLHVPDALLLGIVAGVFDILPIIGFFLSLAPSFAFALTVSPFTATAVVVLYTAYHLVENYFIVPWVYGNRLRLSTLTVLVACLAAGVVGGVVGVIVILPIIASFPVVERMWLRPVLGPETVDRHEEIEEKEHPAE
jgi:predicted PurR-regulated permease PerM